MLAHERSNTVRHSENLGLTSYNFCLQRYVVALLLHQEKWQNVSRIEFGSSSPQMLLELKLDSSL